VIIRFYAYFYPPCIGGGEMILEQQARELAKRGHEVHVHCSPYTNIALTEKTEVGDTTENGVSVHRRRAIHVPFSNPLEQDMVIPAWAYEAFLPADMIVCMGYPSQQLDLLVLRKKRQPNLPLIVQNYVTADFLKEILAGEGGLNKKIRSRYWKTWVRRQLRKADLVVADSPAAAEGLRTELGLDNVICHIGMAVDPVEFDAVTDRQRRAARKALGLGTDKFILAPSRVSPQKGADLLVQAAGPLLKEGWRLAIVGPVNDAAFYEKVRDLAKPYGGRVHFGQLPREKFVSLLQESSIVVLPSRGETVGGVVFEGMYAESAVIVSDAVEAARDDYLQDGVNGLLVPAEDIEALRAALKKLMRRTPKKMIASGRKTVEDRFIWSKSVDSLWIHYKRVLEDCRGR
jgi:glycosyltransferase involved in cell wall biosynthesis